MNPIRNGFSGLARSVMDNPGLIICAGVVVVTLVLFGAMTADAIMRRRRRAQRRRNFQEHVQRMREIQPKAGRETNRSQGRQA